MITYNRSCAKALLFIALSLFLQGCSTFRTCATFLDDEAYKGSLNYKAIAMYFDRETQRPPAQISQVENECWFDYEANSQEEANSIVLSGCEESLKEGQKFEDWSCVLIAEGDQLTATEQQRIDNWKQIAGRTKTDDSRMLSNPAIRPYDPDK